MSDLSGTADFVLQTFGSHCFAFGLHQAGCRGRLPEPVVTICSLQQATSEEVKCYSTIRANGSFMLDVSSFQVIPL